jgi:UDP-2,3-diacylglucosamine hydrolase
VISAWFVSDLHLKHMQERRSELLLRFLSFLADKKAPCTHLYLVGDIFDLWIGDHNYFDEKFAPLIAQIQKIKGNGVQVTYFEGNHDVHVKRYWESRYQIPCYIEEHFDRLGPHFVRVEHGDLINPNDTKYLKYRDFIRQPFIEKLAHVLSPRLIHWLGDHASKQSRKYSSVKRRDSEAELRQMIRSYAENTYAAKPFDLIITGHMHIRDDYTFERDGKKIRSVNLGSWFDEPLIFRLTETGSEWISAENLK